jgi:Mg-chelatase subunit ChlD
LTEFTARTDRQLVRTAHRSRRHVLLSLTAPAARKRKQARQPVNVAFVIDRSGSMAGVPMLLARQAVMQALNGLQPRDRFSVVTYDDQIETVVSSRTATPKAKETAQVRLAEVDARGSTDLHGGWKAGAAQLTANLARDGVNRCLLLTDGLANVGVTDAQQLAAFAADLRASGVTTTTFGMGNQFDEVLLQALADAGGGHYYYIGHPDQIGDFMTSELGELLETVAREVVVDVKHNPLLEIEPLSPVVAAAAAPGELRLLLGDLVAGQRVELVLRLRFPTVPAGNHTNAFFTIGDRDGVLKADGATLAWTHAEDADVDAQPRDADVDRAVARLYAARARAEAVRLNRVGDYAGARHALGGVAMRVASYAGTDAELGGLVAELRDEELRFSTSMREEERKMRHFSSQSIQRSRDPRGGAQH